MSKPQQEIAAPKTVVKNGAAQGTKILTYTATLVAITVILKTLGNILTFSSTIRVSFTYTGWIFSAIILGPLGAASVGLISDIISYFIASSGGAFNPVLTLGNTLFPLIVALCYKYLPLRKDISITIGTIIATFICTMCINSLGIYYMYGYNESIGFFTYLITLRIWQPLIVGINLFICLLLYNFAERLKINLSAE